MSEGCSGLLLFRNKKDPINVASEKEGLSGIQLFSITFWN